MTMNVARAACRWLSLAIAAVFLLASASLGQQAPSPPNGAAFPILPLIITADPAIRHELVVRIPTKLKVVRTTTSLSTSFDLDSPRTVKITVGQDMVTGFETDLRAYPEGTKRPLQSSMLGVQSSALADLSDFDSDATILNASQYGIPAPGTKYVVEEELTIFETDVPTQHMWRPKGSPNYKVLWHGIVAKTVK